ncbi:MAG: flavodoxin [Deltaproteobacteria bacterium HGW-Deltaproteobacteria-24]|jgi:flavodoxin I|nr:MAG: flavodoxin [Deltaproteobacteria bacterium HGW-Deltaproteobacteria-24]
MATAIFYASSTGNTEIIAKQIAKTLGINNIYDISNINIEKINDYDKLIFGASTWGDGDLQDDWDDAWNEFCKLDFSGKTVALFGLGDQESYSDNYVDAMGTIYEQVAQNGAKVVGFTSSDGYEHEESKAQQANGDFVGLALDEDNQSDLTHDRIALWCNQIKDELV